VGHVECTPAEQPPPRSLVVCSFHGGRCVWWLQPARGPFEPGTPPPLLLTSLVQELDAELRTRCGLGPSFFMLRC
jgi:hypothetical protein